MRYHSVVLGLSAITLAMPAQAVDFQVENIQIVGLERLPTETVYANLPFTAGDQVDDAIIEDAIKSLYQTERFETIKMAQQGNDIVISVQERPIISDVRFEGNRLIPEEALTEGLKATGLQVGEPLKPYLIDQVEKDIERQYQMQGYYNSDVEVQVDNIQGNRANVLLRFLEGKPAKVIDVNIIGNQVFSDEEIEDAFIVKPTAWYALLSKSDQFAQEKLAASLENLSALYRNAGYIAFSINNASVNISEDKKNIFIEVSVTEGDQYQFGQTSFLGEPLYQREQLSEQLVYQTDTQYSEQQVTQTTNQLKRLYGNAGYYFAEVRAIPRINNANKTVDIDYFVNPAQPVYVRRINFAGNTKTEDEVLRREMRQLEGALASNEKIELSRIRLQRTGFFKGVRFDIKPVAGTTDQIDVNFTVEEQPSGNTTIAAGYSQSGGVTFQLELQQTNFLGTGNRVNIALSRSETLDSYKIGVTDPYFTVDGVSQGFDLYYRKTKYDSRNINNYVTDSYGGTLSYGYPVDENKSITAGINYDHTTVRAGSLIAISNLDYMLDHNIDIINNLETRKPTDLSFSELANERLSFESEYASYNLNLNWNMNTLDRPIFPTKGISHTLNYDMALPGSDAEYQRLIYQGSYYHPITSGFIGRLSTKLGYGEDLPFYKNFYAGGYGTVRGFEPSTLGPRSARYQFYQNDPYPEEVGGNAIAQFTSELIVPLPFKGDWTSQIRPAFFVEGAQVYDTTDRDNEGFDGSSVPLIKKDQEFRYSAGFGITAITPIGPIAVSYAYPLNEKSKDRTKQLQFEIGRISR